MNTKTLRPVVLIACALPFVAVIVAPLSHYLGNRDQYPISTASLVSSLLVVSVLVAAIIGVILLVINRWGSLFKLLSALCLGLAVSSLIQSQLLTWNFGPLDGRGIDWQRWSLHAAVEIALWVIVIALTVAAAFFKSGALRTVAHWIFIGGIVSLVSAWITAPGRDRAPEQSDDAALFSFHEENNVVLIVLDTMQGDVFEEIAKRWPEDVTFLQGFRFHPDTIGGYPTTRASVPLILGGRLYRNEMPLADWQRENVANRNIVRYFDEQGYGVSLIVNGAGAGGVGFPAAEMSELQFSGWRHLARKVFLVIDGGLFRAAPTKFKPRIYDEGNWLLVQALSDPDEPPGHHGYDVRFLKALQSNAKVGSAISGEFKYFHLRGAHKPLQLDENFKYTGSQENTREAYVRQTRGALQLLNRTLQTLKDLEIYDAAEIVVIGDHGSLGFKPNDLRNEPVNDWKLFDQVLSSSRALLLHKPSGSVGDLTISDEPHHLTDVVCLLSDNDPVSGCQNTSAKPGARSFLFYEWTHKGWANEYLPAITEYVVGGDVRDGSSWSKLPVIYEEGEIRETD